MMTNGDHEGQIFLSHPHHAHTNNGFFFLLTTKYLILYWKKHEQDFQKILNTLRCNMVHHFNITMTSQFKKRLACDCSFLSFPRAGRGMSHMGKNNGNPDLVCEKIHSL